MVAFCVGGKCGDFLQRKLPCNLTAYSDIDVSGGEWVRAALDSELAEQILAAFGPIGGNVERYSTVRGHSIVARFADSQTQDEIFGRRANDFETLLRCQLGRR